MNNQKQQVLIVDDIPDNIQVLMEILKDEFAVTAATRGDRALELARTHQQPDLILLDIMMPEMDGYTVCENLKSNAVTKDIPVIFITAMNEVVSEEKGLALGAVDYITKPFNPGLVKRRVHNHMELKRHRDHLEEEVKKRTAELHATRLEVIRKLGRAAEYKDNETGMHVMRMSHYCKLIAQAIGKSDNEAELILHAAPMHDIGKIGISDKILLKPGKLDDDEWNEMRKHSYYGYKIIGEQSSDLLTVAATVSYEHHEKWNGKGYPQGLAGREISLYGRITAIADVFDALTSKRPYKEPWPVEKALKLIEDEKGEHFDPELVPAFMEVVPEVLKVKDTFSDK